MNDVTSRITNVIETRQGDEISYFTLEGLLIGGFKGGNRVTPMVITGKPIEKPAGGVIKAPTPEQVRRDNDRAAAALQTPEGRLKHLKEDVA